MDSKAKIGKNIKAYRELRNMTQLQLAEEVGCSASTIAMYETGQREPDFDTLETIADVFNIGICELVPHKAAHKIIRLIGSAAAGEPIFDEEVDVYVDVLSRADCAIKVKGDSMQPTFYNGDILLIRSQPDIDYDGQTAIVVLGDECCVKHVYRQPDGLLLTSDNSAYHPMFKRYADYDNNIRVIGKIVGFTRMYSE